MRAAATGSSTKTQRKHRPVRLELALSKKDRSHRRLRTKAIRLDPKLPTTYSTAACDWYAKSDYDRAVAESSEVDRPSILTTPMRRSIAASQICACQEGEDDRAIADFDVAIRLNPERRRVVLQSLETLTPGRPKRVAATTADANCVWRLY